MKTLTAPLIVTGAFVLSCLMPIIQILFLTLDGGLQAIVIKLLFQDNQAKSNAANWLVNLSLSIIFLVLFYKTKTLSGRIIFSILSLIFIFCFFAFLAIDINGETDPYFLYFVIVSLASGLILCATAIIKSNMQHD
jgi:hypothetical protein